LTLKFFRENKLTRRTNQTYVTQIGLFVKESLPMEDSNVARRNLMFMSMAIIAYLYAGGQLADGKLTFQIISLQFEAQEKLAHLAWTLFFWFWLRYYQLSNEHFRAALDQELNSKSQSVFTLWLLRREIKIIQKKSSINYDLKNVKFEPESAELYFNEEYKWHFRVSGYSERTHVDLRKHIARDLSKWQLTPLRGRMNLFLLRLYTGFHGKAFALYMVPHIIAGTAFMMGAASLIE